MPHHVYTLNKIQLSIKQGGFFTLHKPVDVEIATGRPLTKRHREADTEASCIPLLGECHQSLRAR